MLNKKGFTLIELLVTVLIITILLMLAMPQYFKVVERQKGTEALGILASTAKAQERRFAVQENYADKFVLLDAEFVNKDSSQITGALYKTPNFDYTLGTDKVTAVRNINSGAYTITRCYSNANICCEGNMDMCDMFNIPKVCDCSPLADD